MLLSSVSAPAGVYVYPTTTYYQGNLDLYGGLDASLQIICQNDRLLAPIIDLQCQAVAPLVSTSLVPANNLNLLYSDIPYNGPQVRGPFGTIISVQVSTLFASDLVNSFFAAGLGDDVFWSFGDGSGNYAADNCANGTDGTSNSLGQLGSPTIKTQANWFATNILSCSEYHRVLCICYTPQVASGGG